MSKQRNFGFTLIELLAAIFIIGIISVIATPIINRVTNQSRDELYQTQINNITEGAKNWAAKNLIFLPEGTGERITLTLGQLKMDGFIKGDIKNPKNKKLFPNDMEIIVEKGLYGYTYKVMEGTGGENDVLDKNSPSLILNGLAYETVEIHSTYVDKGVIARDPTGKIISAVDVKIRLNNNLVSSVDTSKIAQYIITYTVKYNGIETSAIRNVAVKDTTPPKLTIPGNIKIAIEDVAGFDVMLGVVSTDNSLKTPTVTVTGTLSALPGNYYINYIATDGSGNKISKMRTVTVAKASELVGNYNVKKGLNKPQLIRGMTPIKWSGGSWVETTENDPDWYDYNTQKWANVQTKDGSFWVWIPRFAYRILNGYHTSTPGSITIKFLKEKTNTASDGTTVATSPTYSGSSQTNIVKHPAFTFGTDEILGFWVAKFEPSGTASNISIIPNVKSLRGMTIGDQFDATLSMKHKSKYGWNANDLDSHMMKNTEWGAVAYLSKSVYGANAEVWINNSETYITGCAGYSVDANTAPGCQNAYLTANGQKSSTTHNMYGVYDMNGGAFEHVAAYVNNGHSNLGANGMSIYDAESKYKNEYTTYELSKNVFGDALYETSSSGVGTATWYSGFSYMPETNRPWFQRGGQSQYVLDSSMFSFVGETGQQNSGGTFRPVVIPNK